MLTTSVLVPFLASSLNLPRVYHIALILMAPCLIYGAAGIRSALIQVFPRAKSIRLKSLSTTNISVAALLICYFLFVSGWVWAASMDNPTSLVLDSQRMKDSTSPVLIAEFYSEHTVSSDVAGATWVGTHIANNTICSDYISVEHVLDSYGGLARSEPILPQCGYSHSMIFLSEFNEGTGLATSYNAKTWSIANITLILQSENRIYSGVATISSPLMMP
jgi:uncharacterized membrane protein